MQLDVTIEIHITQAVNIYIYMYFQIILVYI